MADIPVRFLKELFVLFVEIAPYLLLGMTVAGVLSVFIRKEFVARHVGGHDMASVFKAALLGVPLPLCSCGVVPTASYLRKYGASRPAVMSFLISTPQTGVDSLAATWGMLGPLFAVFRALTALITGLAGGAASFLFDRSSRQEGDSTGAADDTRPSGWRGKTAHFLRYAYRESVDDIAVHFVIGLAVAALITMIIPDNFFEGTLLGGGLSSMLLMVVIGIPMYICSTSSIPIAVALILKGFSPGAAYVFLVAGPATNAATLAILFRVLGRKQVIFYLATIISGSLVFGLLMNGITGLTGWTFAGSVMNHGMEFNYLDYGFAAVFLVLLVLSFLGKAGIGRKSSGTESCTTGNCISDEGEKKMPDEIELNVEGMNCNHCTATVRDALVSVPGVEGAEVDLSGRRAVVKGRADRRALEDAVEKAGYRVV